MGKRYTVLALVVIAAAALFGTVSFLSQNWGANQTPGAVERFFARWFLGRSQASQPELQNPLPRDEQNLAAGRTVYEKHCSFCHGMDGRGPGENGPQFYPPVPSLATPDAEGRQPLTDSQMYYIVRQGVRYTGMPSFEKVLSQEETWQAIEWVDQLSARAPASSGGSAP